MPRRKRGGFERRPVEAEGDRGALSHRDGECRGRRRCASGVSPGPLEIDLLAVHGLGLPRWRGGPLVNADIEGLLKLDKAAEALFRGRAGALDAGPAGRHAREERQALRVPERLICSAYACSAGPCRDPSGRGERRARTPSPERARRSPA